MARDLADDVVSKQYSTLTEVIHRYNNHVASQRKSNPANSKLRQFESDRFIAVCTEMNQLVRSANETTAATAAYNLLEIQLSSQLSSEITEVTMESLDSDDSTQAITLKRLTACQEKIKSIAHVRNSLQDRVRDLLVKHYSVPPTSKVTEKALAMATTRELKLPANLGGAPNPIVGNQLITALRSCLHGYCYQAWALIVVLERMFTDVSITNTHWQPPPVADLETSIFRDYPALHAPLRTQSQLLYDLLEKLNYTATRKTLSTIITGVGNRDAVHSRATFGDGIAVVSFLIHYHAQSGYKQKQQLRDSFNFMHGAFASGDIIKTVASFRKYLPIAQRLKVKLQYDSVILQTTMTLCERSNAFVTPLEPYLTCDPAYDEDDCGDLVDAFLSQIERTAQNLRSVPSAGTRDSEQARKMFDAFYSQLENTDDYKLDKPATKRSNNGNHNNNNNSKGGQQSKHICAAKGCTHTISQTIWNTLKTGPRPQSSILCSTCWKRMLENGSVQLEHGGVRRSESKKSQRAFIALKMIPKGGGPLVAARNSARKSANQLRAGAFRAQDLERALNRRNSIASTAEPEQEDIADDSSEIDVQLDSILADSLDLFPARVRK